MANNIENLALLVKGGGSRWTVRWSKACGKHCLKSKCHQTSLLGHSAATQCLKRASPRPKQTQLCLRTHMGNKNKATTCLESSVRQQGMLDFGRFAKKCGSFDLNLLFLVSLTDCVVCCRTWSIMFPERSKEGKKDEKRKEWCPVLAGRLHSSSGGTTLKNKQIAGLMFSPPESEPPHAGPGNLYSHAAQSTGAWSYPPVPPSPGSTWGWVTQKQIQRWGCGSRGCVQPPPTVALGGNSTSAVLVPPTVGGARLAFGRCKPQGRDSMLTAAGGGLCQRAKKIQAGHPQRCYSSVRQGRSEHWP